MTQHNTIGQLRAPSNQPIQPTPPPQLTIPRSHCKDNCTVLHAPQSPNADLSIKLNAALPTPPWLNCYTVNSPFISCWPPFTGVLTKLMLTPFNSRGPPFTGVLTKLIMIQKLIRQCKYMNEILWRFKQQSAKAKVAQLDRNMIDWYHVHLIIRKK